MARRTRNSKGRFTSKKKSARKLSGFAGARARRRRRRNGVSVAAARHGMVSSTPKRRKRRSKARRAARSGRRIRPTILVTRSGHYRRPARSKYFKRPRMVNGKRRRVSRRRNGLGGNLMSIVKRTLTVSTLSGYLSIGGGIFAGAMLSKMLNTGTIPFTSTALPASVTDITTSKYARPFQGILHIVLGAVIASKVKNKYIKDAGMGLAALGGYDLLTQALSAMGIANLPTFSGMNVNLLGGHTSYSGMNVDLLGGGMNVDMRGMARSRDAESSFLVDNINDMLS